MVSNMASKRVTEFGNSAASKLVGSLQMLMESETEISVPEGNFDFRATIQTPYVVLNNFSVNGEAPFDFEFEVPFDDDLIANEAKFVIYNLSKSTVNKFKMGNTVSLTAGYGEDRSIVFEGWISEVKTKYDGIDKVTTIYALDDVKYTPEMMNEVTYEKGTSASYILKELLNRLNLSVEVFKPQRDHIFDDETKISGSIVENIKTYADICGVSVYINKQKVYCRPIWDGDNLRFTVNADTGMIESPELFIEENTNEEYTDTVHGYNVKMIFQRRINTAGIVKLNSKNYSGEYRIVSGEHKYDGLSATTEFKCIEAIFTSIDESKVGGKGDGAYGETNDVNWQKKDLPVPAAALSAKAMESYTAITSTGTLNYKISHGAESQTNGLRRYHVNFYVLAMGTYYGGVGTYVKITFENGKTIYAILGDQKADEHTDSRHMYTLHDMSTLEFQVDPAIISCTPGNIDTAAFNRALEEDGIGQNTKITNIWTSDVEPTFGYIGGGNAVIEKAVNWAIDIAKDDSHGYDQGANRWTQDYDCSALVIQAYEQAGVPVRSQGGASSTFNMYDIFTKYGFEDVTSSVNLNTGVGTKKGDVLLNVNHHTCIVIEDGGRRVNAGSNEFGGITGGRPGDQTGNEIAIKEYVNYPWDYVLRYTG